jgi:glyoxylase-like metal-dependent hydrolase (beta-lactamase superfamily II)
MHPEDCVVNRLASIGLQPDNIHFLVCTHFDPDHAGNHELFSRAELLVQRSHYEVARAGHPRSQVVREHWDAPWLRYRLVGIRSPNQDRWQFRDRPFDGHEDQIAGSNQTDFLSYPSQPDGERCR